MTLSLSRHPRLVIGLGAALLAGAALAQIDAPQANLQAIGDQQEAVSQTLGEERNRIARLLTALVMFRREPPPALITSPAQALNAVRSAMLAREIAPLLAARAKALA
ncbi:MAG: peptidase, partial [Caulobacteraceae bacterium]|nr:peptidase [Caulobacteraceae bacterium]